MRQHTESKGSAGGSEKRTSFVTQVTVAIPFSRWGAQPYVTYPFLFPIANTDAVRAPVNDTIDAVEEVRHPIRLALEWRQMLADNPGLNMAGIAQIKGVSRARVTQVMNLLRLPEQVQTVLLGVTPPRAPQAQGTRNAADCAAPRSVNTDRSDDQPLLPPREGRSVEQTNHCRQLHSSRRAPVENRRRIPSHSKQEGCHTWAVEAKGNAAGQRRSSDGNP